MDGIIFQKKMKVGMITFLILLSINLFSQGSLIRGTVKNKMDGKSLDNVKIRLFNPKNGTQFICNSNKKGEFMHAGIPLGFYEVMVNEKGYFPYKSNLRSDGFNSFSIDIELEKIPEKLDEDPFFIKGLNHFEAKQFAEAAVAFRESIKKFPDSVDAHYNLAVSLFENNDLDQAEEIFHKVIRLKDDNSKVYYALGLIYAKKKNTQKAVEAFTKATEIDPENEMAFYNLGIILYQDNKPDQALAKFKKTIELNPSFAAAYYQAGVASISQELYQEAVALLEKFLALEPGAPEADQIRATIEELKKNPH